MRSDNPLWEIIEPYLVRLGLYTVSDPTYGRYLLPPHPPHMSLIQDPAVSHTYRRIFLPPYEAFPTRQEAYDSTAVTHAEDVELTADELRSGLARGGRWVFYSIWEVTEEPKGGWEAGGRGRGRDMVLIHGLSDYGLRYAPHVHHFLMAGFRVIIPDLPAYGRSTGIHSHLPSILLLPAALHAVLTDMVQNDVNRGREQSQVFLSGASMGGWTVLYYLMKYPPTSSPMGVIFSATQANKPPPVEGLEKDRVQIAGAFVLCPMVEIAKNSRPSWIVERIGRVIVSFAGALPLAKSVRGNVSDDPAVETDFYADPLCYHGYLRVETGLALLEGMTELEKRASEIDIPIRIIHGSGDRVTSHLGTLKLFDRLPNEDKEIEIYEGYEHVMIKVGRDTADDEKRQRVLADWRSWLLQRC